MPRAAVIKEHWVPLDTLGLWLRHPRPAQLGAVTRATTHGSQRRRDPTTTLHHLLKASERILGHIIERILLGHYRRECGAFVRRTAVPETSDSLPRLEIRIGNEPLYRPAPTASVSLVRGNRHDFIERILGHDFLSQQNPSRTSEPLVCVRCRLQLHGGARACGDHQGVMHCRWYCTSFEGFCTQVTEIPRTGSSLCMWP